MEEKEVQKISVPSLRLTPLNILSAIAVVAACYFVVRGGGNGMEQSLNWLFFGLCMLAAVVCFVSDLIFRKMFPQLKKLWIIELAFVAFAFVMTLIIKIVLFN